MLIVSVVVCSQITVHISFWKEVNEERDMGKTILSFDLCTKRFNILKNLIFNIAREEVLYLGTYS